MKRKSSIFILALIMSVSMNVTVHAATTVHDNTKQLQLEAMSQTITPYADVITYEFREYYGKLQMRRWNETRGYWVDPEWTTISIH